MRILISVGLLTFMVAQAQAAAEPVSLGAFQDWEAYTYKSKAAPVCYVMSKPKDSQASRNSKRDAVYFMVTHWPGRKVYGEVSTIIGYPFREGTVAKLQVGDEVYNLPTNGDSAWVPMPRDETRIIAALREGHSLKVTGTSWKGTQTTDTYSLVGFSAAIDRINEACK